METDEEKKDERLPCGMKAEFTNFKFDNDKPSSSSSSQQQRQEQRLPNGQRAHFNNFSFDDKPAAKTATPVTTKTELFPFKDFKFPDKKMEPTLTQKQKQPDASSSKDEHPL